MEISYSVARILSRIAEAEATDLGVPMAIAVADAKGGLVFFVRMDGTLPASTEIAVSKAYTAAALRMSTQKVGELAQPGEVLYGVQHILTGKIVLFGGGIPLSLKGQVVGAVGISGGSVMEDIKVAEAVRNSLAKMEYWIEVLRPVLPAKPEGASWIFHLSNKLKELLDDSDRVEDPVLSMILSGAILLAYAEN